MISHDSFGKIMVAALTETGAADRSAVPKKCIGFPPLRQKKGAKMGHGDSIR
jgi:hypothetical protein